MTTSPNVTTPLLRIVDVAKAFGAVRALRGVSFDLLPGEVHALLGENGAGKSTLIKIVTGAHQPESGSLEIEGRLVSNLTPRLAHRLGVACIYQQPALFPDLTVAENITLRLEPPKLWQRVHWRDSRTRAASLLEKVGANISPDAEVRELSMPEQQLVEIACALGAGARIVIMDEPTASLTQKEQHLLFGVVGELRRQGLGIIYISHRLEEIFALADRVTVLRDGRSVGTFPVRNITEADLIRHMVGRDVSQLFPPRSSSIGTTTMSLRGITCRAGGVKNISLDLHAGEIIGMAGLVGAGRTELARVLFGITPSDSGEIWLEGKPVSIRSPGDAVRQRVAYVPEDRRRHGILLEMAIAANMTLAIHPRLFKRGWLNPTKEGEVASRYVQDLGIKAASTNAPGGSLSGGNQQKVALARWLATDPRVLILDEPTQGVDVGAKGEIHKIIRRLAESGMAILMISSDLPEVLGMSDRIVVMRQGSIAAALPGGASADDVMSAAVGPQCGEDA